MAEQRQARYLFRYLSHLGTKMIVAENKYVDRDYLDDYACFWVRSFQDYPRLTKRLHFFNDSLTKVEIAGVFAATHPVLEKKLKASYNGFVVVRPLPRAVIGRTVLRPYEPEGAAHDYPVDRFYPVTRDYHPNIFGIELTIESLAYEQQDTVVAACATVSLWSAFHKTQRLFDSLRPSPSQVTRLANVVRGSSREMPSHSLTLEQMGQAIISAGLEPEYVEMQPETPLSSLLYGYIDMGVPVVLLVYLRCDDGSAGFHAVTVLGYALPKSDMPADQKKPSQEPKGRVSYKAHDIDRFYVHDDNIGPFAYMLIVRVPDELKDEKINPDAAEHFASAPYALEASWYEGEERRVALAAPMVSVIPIDPLIRLTYLGLHKWLDRLAEILEAYAGELSISLDVIVWDVRLQQTKDLKRDLREIAKGSSTAAAILITPYPLYVWRVTVQTSDSDLLDIFADATEVDTAFPLLDVVYYNASVSTKLRGIFAVQEVRDKWAPLVGRQLVDFLATKGLNT